MDHLSLSPSYILIPSPILRHGEGKREGGFGRRYLRCHHFYWVKLNAERKKTNVKALFVSRPSSMREHQASLIETFVSILLTRRGVDAEHGPPMRTEREHGTFRYKRRNLFYVDGNDALRCQQILLSQLNCSHRSACDSPSRGKAFT